MKINFVLLTWKALGIDDNFFIDPFEQVNNINLTKLPSFKLGDLKNR